MRKLSVVALALFSVSIAACRDTGREGEAEIERPVIGTTTDTIQYPTVDVGTDTQTVRVPDIDVTTPGERRQQNP